MHIGLSIAAHLIVVSAAIEQRFQQTGYPRDLTLVYAAGQGDGDARSRKGTASDVRDRTRRV